MRSIEHQNPRPPRPLSAPTPDEDAEPGALKHVLGVDNRVRIANSRAYPHSAIVSVLTRWGNDWYGCSGAVVQPLFVMTAGHCVYNHAFGGWPDELIVIPGKNGASEPFGRWDWQRAVSLGGWVDDRNFDYDVGLIEIRGAIGDRVGHLGFRYDPDPVLWSALLHSAGLPLADQLMYGQTCTVADMNRWQMAHTCDIDAGDSGAPLWIEDGDWQVAAVVTGSSTDGPPTNFATRVSEEVFAFLADAFGFCGNTCAFGASMCGAGGTRLSCRASVIGCTEWLSDPCPADAACDGGICACADDGFEPNDDDRSSQPIVPGTYADLAICSGDDDWFVVEVRRGERLRAQIDFVHAAGDLDLTLYDSAGGIIAMSNGASDREQVEALAERDATWQLRVYGFAGSAGRYTLSLSRERGAPAGWQCAPDSYGGGDGCDCECGASDPDCATRAVDARGCRDDEICMAGACVCQPDCAGRACGDDDGCGGECRSACDDPPMRDLERDGGPSSGGGAGADTDPLGADGGASGGGGGRGDGDGCAVRGVGGSGAPGWVSALCVIALLGWRSATRRRG